MTTPFTFDVLPNGDVVLPLGEGCIQTCARRARQEVVDVLLAGDANGVVIEPVIELLDLFLGTADFRRLRAEHPELAGEMPCHVRLHRTPDGTVQWEIITTDEHAIG
jgi:hypothetical protein